MSLSPRELVDQIRKVLRKERGMREWVFKNALPKMRTKVAEIDEALRHLEALEKLVCQQEAPQGNLFGEGA